MPHAPRPLVWILLAAAWIYVGAVVAERPGIKPHGPPPREPAAAPAPSPFAAITPAPAPTASPAANNPQPAITIAFWNVEWFPGRKPNASDNAKASHLLAVVPVLEKLNPDLLGLEEVADAPAAQSLADHLPGFKVDICSDFPHPDTPGSQQVVLCSRLPVLQAWAEPWKPAKDGMQPRRGFAVAAYQTAPGQVLIAYALHLKSNRVDTSGGAADNFAMREESARQLVVHAKAMQAAYRSMGNVTVVVGGDLNTSLDDPQFAAETTLRDLQAAGFQWVWKGVPLESRYTLPPSRYPATCFDHVFLLGTGLQFAEPFVEQTNKTSSDHRPVTVKLVTAAPVQ